MEFVENQLNQALLEIAKAGPTPPTTGSWAEAMKDWVNKMEVMWHTMVKKICLMQKMSCYLALFYCNMCFFQFE